MHCMGHSIEVNATKSSVVELTLKRVRFLTITPIIRISAFVNNGSTNLDVFTIVRASVSKTQSTVEVLQVSFAELHFSELSRPRTHDLDH